MGGSRPWKRIDAVVENATISGVLLDRDGTILEVSTGWKLSAERLGLRLANHGIGHNYLKYCLSTDDGSLEIYRGLQQLLLGRSRVFSSLYSCSVNQQKHWFLLVASSHDEPDSTVAVLHLQLSGLLGHGDLADAETIGQRSDVAQLSDILVKAIRGSIAEALGSPTAHAQRLGVAVDSNDQRALARLTPRQRIILKHIADGLTNAQIAEALSISLSAAKTQTATIIRKLNFQNRTQAALFAARAGLG